MQQLDDHLRSILNESTDLIWSVDEDYRLIYSNRQFNNVVKYMSGHVVSGGENVLEIGFSSDQIIRWKSRYDRGMSGETFVEIEYFDLPTERWSEISVHPISENGKITSVACFAHDVTEQKINENKLRHSEKRLRQAQELAHFGSWEVNFASGVGTWSEEACRIYGLDPSDNQHTRDKWLSFVHPDDREYVASATTESLRNLNGSSMFHRIVCPDGTIKHVKSMSYLEFNEEGHPIGLYGVTHDVTDVKVAEEALSRSEANLKQIVDLIPHPIYVKDARGNFLFANKQVGKMFGVRAEELVGTNASRLFPPQEVSELLWQDQEVLSREGKLIFNEVTVTRPDGDERIMSIIKVPYLPPQQQELAVLGIAFDVTEQRKSERERNKMMADIMRHNNDLEQFSYVVSHVLRRPVANILGLVRIIETQEHDEQERELVSDMAECVSNLDEVVKDLNYILQARYAHTETKEMIRFTDIAEITKASIDDKKNAGENPRIITDFSAAEEMLAFKSSLFGIFYNIIRYSTQCPTPDKRPTIWISSHVQNNNLILVFRNNCTNNNPELDKANANKLLDETPSKIERHGIGLYVVKALVESMRGTIKIKNVENAGIEFRMEFEQPDNTLNK